LRRLGWEQTPKKGKGEVPHQADHVEIDQKKEGLAKIPTEIPLKKFVFLFWAARKKKCPSLKEYHRKSGRRKWGEPERTKAEGKGREGKGGGQEKGTPGGNIKARKKRKLLDVSKIPHILLKELEWGTGERGRGPLQIDGLGEDLKGNVLFKQKRRPPGKRQQTSFPLDKMSCKKGGKEWKGGVL